MIEMQWVTAPLQTAGNVGVFQSYGTNYKLQFREVFKDPYSKLENATEWQDVEIAKDAV